VTNNQFLYAQLEVQKRTASEQHRANVMRENETYRHDVANELLTASQISESMRHNMAAEANDRYRNYETARHNQVDESIRYYDLDERSRHNRVTESQTDYANYTSRLAMEETKRHNVMGEALESRKIAETYRHDKATENLTNRSIINDVRRISNDAEKVNVEKAKLAETIRYDTGRLELDARSRDIQSQQAAAARQQADTARDRLSFESNLKSKEYELNKYRTRVDIFQQFNPLSSQNAANAAKMLLKAGGLK
jgi:hypothetical protein